MSCSAGMVFIVPSLHSALNALSLCSSTTAFRSPDEQKRLSPTPLSHEPLEWQLPSSVHHLSPLGEALTWNCSPSQKSLSFSGPGSTSLLSITRTPHALYSLRSSKAGRQGMQERCRLAALQPRPPCSSPDVALLLRWGAGGRAGLLCRGVHAQMRRIRCWRSQRCELCAAIESCACGTCLAAGRCCCRTPLLLNGVRDGPCPALGADQGA